MTPRQLLTSNRQDWQTPKPLFDKLNAVFHCELDPCTSHDNPLGCKYFITEMQNSLDKPWMFNAFMNPPYKDIKKWVIKAYEESVKHQTTNVCLITAKVDTAIWHEVIYPHAVGICYKRKRICFGPTFTPSTFPSAIVVFGPNKLSRKQRACLRSLGHVEK